MAGREGGSNSNAHWERNYVRPGEDEPIEVTEEEWKFGNRINDVPEEEWNKNPQKAYDDAVVGDLDE